MTPSAVAASGLFTDLYELVMAQLYYERGVVAPAVFELSARSLPRGWGFLLAAGLEQTLEQIEALRFDEDELVYLAGLPQFDDAFIERLRGFRFTGEVWAPPEGSAIFPHEPLLQVIAPLPQAQLLETLVINQIGAATLVASKAARAVSAAAGAPLLEFGGRRAHGVDAALSAARSAYLAGFAATSSVEAGKRFGIPVVGTMAHSYVLAAEDELSAFRAFAERYSDATLLVDTYDTARGVERAIAVARELGAGRIAAIRIDSGDLGAETTRARGMLDDAGLLDVRIIVSGGLDEHQIGELVERGAPIDAFAAGTAVVVSQDAPSLDAVYKLVEYDGRPRAKRSPGKPSLPRRKQVWRRSGGGEIVEDRIMPFDAPPPDNPPEGWEPLLRQVMVDGRRTDEPRETLSELRERAAAQVAALPAELRGLRVESAFSAVIEGSLRL